METKICRVCGIEKNIEDFNNCSGRKCRRTECKECQKEINKQYREKHKERLNQKHKEYVEKNKENYKIYAHNCYIKNKDKRQKNAKEYYNKHSDEIKEYNQKYYQHNKNKIKECVKKYREENKEYLVKKQEEYNKKKRKEDKLFKLKTNIRNTINRSFTRKEYQKNKHTEEIIGCSIDFFIEYIMNSYKKIYGYEWDGVEKVHIDHIIPLATANTEEEVIKLCNYKNLQLLKEKDNLQKSSKINYELKGE